MQNDTASDTATDGASNANSGIAIEQRIEGAAAMQAGSMKMARVGERRIAVIRTASGFHALDNACPHEGYGLVTGALDGELVTCQWHNWKFDVRTGTCVMGEENVARHATRVDGDDVVVTVKQPTAEELLAQLWPSLRRGIERDYIGMIARDVARLLQAGASAEDIMAEGLALGLPRTEWGVGHEMAVAADLLDLTDGREGLDKTLPLVHALTGVAEAARDRPERTQAVLADLVAGMAGEAGDGSSDGFLQAVENEDWNGAVSAVRTFRQAGGDLAALRSWFIEAASAHLLGYGHGAIYVQKAFRLAERLPQLSEMLLDELALTLISDTREDTLPYMRKTMRAIAEVDLAELASAVSSSDWADPDNALLSALIESEDPPIAALVEAGLNGAGVEGIIDTVTRAGSLELLALDVTVDLDPASGFGWLDLTHVVTYANAARWAWQQDPGAHTARLALFTGFLAWDAAGRGRVRDALHFTAEHFKDAQSSPGDAGGGDVLDAIVAGRPEVAVQCAFGGDRSTVASQLEQASMEVSAGSFIVNAHLTKLAVAARVEADALDSNLPLAAAARFLAAPRTERFVAGNVANAVNFVETGQPPRR